MRTHPATGKKLTTPLWYAVAAIITTPIAAICMILTAVILILGWPLIPILCYFHRRDEISKANTE